MDEGRGAEPPCICFSIDLSILFRRKLLVGRNEDRDAAKRIECISDA